MATLAALENLGVARSAFGTRCPVSERLQQNPERNGTKRNGTKRNETKWKRSSKVCTLMKYDETSGPSLRLAGRQWL